jgi:hypothetical protein
VLLRLGGKVWTVLWLDVPGEVYDDEDDDDDAEDAESEHLAPYVSVVLAAQFSLDFLKRLGMVAVSAIAVHGQGIMPRAPDVCCGEWVRIDQSKRVS